MTGLEHSAHVLEKGGKVFSATLGLVDIVKGTNSYYKLQLLEDDRESRCAGGGSGQQSCAERLSVLLGSQPPCEGHGCVVRPAVREGRGPRSGQPFCPHSSVLPRAPQLLKALGFASVCMFYLNIVEAGKSQFWGAEGLGWLGHAHFSSRGSSLPRRWALIAASTEQELYVSGEGVFSSKGRGESPFIY